MTNNTGLALLLLICTYLGSRFAELLAHYLEEALGTNAFDALVLVAPPHFLGMLHGTLAKQTAKHLKATINKDLVMFDAAGIRERLIDTAFPPESSGHRE
jgi:protein required for attachment to host cells